jgi:polysaccharide export outer membrane protein
MRKRRTLAGAGRRIVLVAAALATLPGCAMLNSFFDPTTVGQFPAEAKDRKPIRRVLSPRDMAPGPANAVEPTPQDLVPTFDEYRVVPADQMQIVIEDLLGQGAAEVAVKQVSDTGFIRLPRLGSIKVAGLTEQEIEEDIAQRLRAAGELPDPIVRVTLTTRRLRVFQVLGSVGRAGTYPLTSTDMRLLDAIGMAQDIGASVKKLYVIRRTSSDALPDVTPEPPPPADGLVIPPPVEDEPAPAPVSGAVLASSATGAPRIALAEPTDPDQAMLDEALRPERPADTSPGGPALDPFIIIDAETGESVPVTPARPAEELAAPAPRTPTPVAEQVPFEWEAVPEYELQQRVIEIDVAALKGGDPRYNIVVREQDVINVPIDTGVFYVMGEVNRPGVYAFGDREITVSQAIALVGGFSPLAWPQRCEIIRRVKGTDDQMVIPINVDHIYAGLEADVLLRDEDILNVGTHFVSPFLFVIRNSFRFTYGFGFVYDRNFADKDSYSSQANPTDVQRAQRASRGLPF